MNGSKKNLPNLSKLYEAEQKVIRAAIDWTNQRHNQVNGPNSFYNTWEPLYKAVVAYKKAGGK